MDACMYVDAWFLELPSLTSSGDISLNSRVDTCTYVHVCSRYV